MKLRGIEYGSCLDAAGLRGFWRDGWWFHDLPIINGWYDFTGSTFVAKTTTTPPREGNMPSDLRWRPTERFPRCIHVDLVKGIVINSVGLGGPGAEEVLRRGLDTESITESAWPLARPYMISWAPEGATQEKRVEEFSSFVRLLKLRLAAKPWLRKRMGLQINISCPNTKVKIAQLLEEIGALLDMAAELDIPILVKINLLVPPEAVLRFSEHPACDGICLSNTIPFGQLPNRIPWDDWFPNGSPLPEEFGGGGLSGWPLLPLVGERLRELRGIGMKKPVNAGGGILRARDVDWLADQGLRPGIDSVFIGSVAILRPWNIKSVVRRAHERLDLSY